MPKHFYIQQNSEITEAISSSSVVNKIYDMIVQDELTHDIFTNDSNFIGKIYTPPTYQEYIDKINNVNYFPDLNINPSDIYIKFADPVVEQILLNNGIGDGQGITKTAAAAVTSIPSFEQNTDITSFDELIYFTNVKRLDGYSFQQCSNLTSIDLSNITNLGTKCFQKCTSLTNIHTDLSKLTNITYDDTFAQCPITGDIRLVNIVNNNGFIMPFIKTQIRSITAGPGGIGEVGGRNMALGWANYPSSPNLIYMDLGNSSITRVADYGFNTIKSLKLCIFPTTLTKFGNDVFTSCESLEAIIIKATTPPIYDGETYQGTQYILWNPSRKPNANVKLYVPKNSLTAYQNDTVWGQYADIMLTIEDDFVKPDYFEDYYNDYS